MLRGAVKTGRRIGELHACAAAEARHECVRCWPAMPVFKRLDDDEKWKSSALDDHQLDVIASLSIWTGEMTTAELSALGRRFCATQAVVNSAITLLTMNYELGGERTNGLLAVALWCCWGGFGFARFTQALRYRWQGPLVIFLVLTARLGLHGVELRRAGQRRFRLPARVQAASLREGRFGARFGGARRGGDLWLRRGDARRRLSSIQATFRLAHLVKAIVTSLPLYACVGMVLKMQGEHAVLAADALARGGIARGARERRGAT